MNANRARRVPTVSRRRLIASAGLGIGTVAAQQHPLATGVEHPAGAPLARAQRQHGGNGQQLAPGDQAARLRFKCTSRIETAAGVTPAMRAAWPTVAGRICASFCRTSFDSPATCA